MLSFQVLTARNEPNCMYQSGNIEEDQEKKVDPELSPEAIHEENGQRRKDNGEQNQQDFRSRPIARFAMIATLAIIVAVITVVVAGVHFIAFHPILIDKQYI